MVPSPSPQPHPTSSHRTMDMTGATTTWTYREGTILHMERGLRVKVDKTPTSRKPVQKLSWRDSNWVHGFDKCGHEQYGMHRKVGPPQPAPVPSNQCFHHCCEPNSRDVLRRVLALAENGHHRQAASLITRLDHATFKNLLAEFPVELAVETIPSSIPILEALYARVFLSDGLQFSMKLLQPEAVVIKMVRFVAEDGPYLPPTLPVPRPGSSCKDSMNLNNAKMYHQSQMMLTNCERNTIFSSCKKILKVITHSDPSVKLTLQAKRRALDGAIDGLSQHGLVGIHVDDSSSNVSQALGNGEALVDLHEALKLELEKLVSRLKTAIQKLDELAAMGGSTIAGTIGPYGTSGTIGKFSGVNFGSGGTVSVRANCKTIPVEAGHQRLLSLRSDQIESRLIRNKTLLNALEPAFPAKALEGLLGLLRHRVDHDKDALFQFTQLKKEAPHVVATVTTSDAAVAPLLMRFARGCRIVLRMMADVSGTDLDCNCVDDEDVDIEDTSSSDISGYHSDSDSTFMAGGVLQNGRHGPKTSRITILRTAMRSNSGGSNDDDRYTGRGRPRQRKSDFHIPVAQDSNGTIPKSIIGRPCTSGPTPTSSTIMTCADMEIAPIKKEVESLRCELLRAKQTIANLQERDKKMTERLAEQAQKMVERGSRFENVALGDKRPSALVRRYGNLYAQARVDTLDALDNLPELRDSDELKSKLLFSVIVLAFRSAQSGIRDIKQHIRKIIQMPEHEVDAAGIELEIGVGIYLQKTIDRYDVKKNVEEVCCQIWATLYDYPCLKTCDRLVQYIRDCVRLAWGLCNQSPPFVIEYDTRLFRREMHVRFHSSDQDSEHIKTYLWPALLESERGPCVHKGVVVT